MELVTLEAPHWRILVGEIARAVFSVLSAKGAPCVPTHVADCLAPVGHRSSCSTRQSLQLHGRAARRLGTRPRTANREPMTMSAMACVSPRGHHRHYTGEKRVIGGLAGERVPTGLRIGLHGEPPDDELAENLLCDLRLPRQQPSPFGQPGAQFVPDSVAPLRFLPCTRSPDPPAPAARAGW